MSRWAIAVGLAAGLVATVVMDVSMVAMFFALDIPADIFFRFIGDSVAAVLSLLGVATRGGVVTGAIVHYALGLLLGVVFVVAAERGLVRNTGAGKAVASAFLFAQGVSLPLTVLAVSILGLRGTELVQMLTIAVALHVVWGCALGLVVHRVSPAREDVARV